MLAKRTLFCLKFLTTPSAPLRNGIFLLVAQPPLLGKEGNGPVSERHASQVVGHFCITLRISRRRHASIRGRGPAWNCRGSGIRSPVQAPGRRECVQSERGRGSTPDDRRRGQRSTGEHESKEPYARRAAGGTHWPK